MQIDNPPAVWPAGGVHSSIWDFARFVTFHLQGARGEGRLLKAETFSRLHYPPEGETYAMGWLRGRADWADNGYTLTHTGSNTLNFAEMWIAPKINFAAVAVTNIGDQPGERTTGDVIAAIIAKYAKASAATPPA
jgi:CubicO group peptidase (beta-lactamase class C family)